MFKKLGQFGHYAGAPFGLLIVVAVAIWDGSLFFVALASFSAGMITMLAGAMACIDSIFKSRATDSFERRYRAMLVLFGREPAPEKEYKTVAWEDRQGGDEIKFGESWFTLIQIYGKFHIQVTDTSLVAVHPDSPREVRRRITDEPPVEAL